MASILAVLSRRIFRTTQGRFARARPDVIVLALFVIATTFIPIASAVTPAGPQCVTATEDKTNRGTVPAQSTTTPVKTHSFGDASKLKIVPDWCFDENSCLTYSPLQYNETSATDVTKAADDANIGKPGYFSTTIASGDNIPSRGGVVWIVQLDTLPTLYSHAGSAQKPYTLSFWHRQHKSNSVENNSTRFPSLTIRASIASSVGVDLATLNGKPFYGNFQSAQLISAPGGDAQQSLVFTSKTDKWTLQSAAFYLKDTCIGCRLLLHVSYDSWPSWWGNQLYFGNLTLTEPPVTLADVPSHHVTEHEVATIPVMPHLSTSIPPRTNCPHLSPDVKLWHDAVTWGGPEALPAAGGSVTLPANTIVLIRSCSISAGIVFKDIVIPATSALVFDDGDITLEAHNIVVYGKLQAGSPTCRLYSRIDIVLHGNKEEVLATHDVKTSKGIVALGGTIDLHGKEYYTWARLAKTTYPGDMQITLQEPVNWEAGQQIVVVTTIFRDYETDQNEVVTVAGVDAAGTTVALTQALAFVHYAGREYQAEVGLLSRRIRVLGNEADSVATSFGGHVMVAQHGIGRFSGVAAVRMGQKNVLARYPFHFHVLGASPDSFVRDCAVVQSFFRCVVVHGTDNATVARNVAFDVQGHCYYLEDGVEENNVFEFNLGAFIHTIFRAAAGWGQTGEVFVESDELRNPADTAAGAFYITNAMNRFVGNAASGGWTGYAFPNLPRPIGAHKDLDFSETLRNPLNRNILAFDGNTAHSASGQWWQAGCVYVGGSLYTRSSDGLLEYFTGRNSRQTFDDSGRQVFMKFTNTAVALCTIGINHWGDNVEVHSFEAHDIKRSAVLFGQAYLHRALSNGRTPNSEIVDLHIGAREGFQYYDTWVATMLNNVTFRNYNYDLGDVVILGMTHSDTYKPQGINAAKNIRYENCGRKGILAIADVPTGSSWMYNIIDYDGSMSMRGRPTIIGSHQSWFNYDSTCVKDADWDLWLCDKGSRDIASMEIIMPGITRTNAEEGLFESHRHIGYMSLGSSPDSTRLILTKNPTTTGISNAVWVMRLFGGSPTTVRIDTIQIPKNNFVVLAIPYPSTAVINVTILQKYYVWPDPVVYPVRRVNSLEELMRPEELSEADSRPCGETWDFLLCAPASAPGPAWMFDGKMLYVRMVDIALYANTYKGFPDGKFERDGMMLNTIESGFQWSIDATCTDTCASHSPTTCFIPDSAKLPNTTVDIPTAQYVCARTGVDPASPSITAHPATKYVVLCFQTACHITNNRLDGVRELFTLGANDEFVGVGKDPSAVVLYVRNKSTGLVTESRDYGATFAVTDASNARIDNLLPTTTVDVDADPNAASLLSVAGEVWRVTSRGVSLASSNRERMRWSCSKACPNS
eukprot:Opistho-2@5312